MPHTFPYQYVMSHTTHQITQVYISIGANLGDYQDTFQSVLIDLQKHMQDVHISPIYRSKPINCPQNSPDYHNAVIALKTYMDATTLLDYLLNLEKKYGRTRPYLNAPRTLDLDLLLYGDMQCQTPQLTLPHPRMHLRAFVLYPLHDLAPELILPQGTWRQLLNHCANQHTQKIPTQSLTI